MNIGPGTLVAVVGLLCWKLGGWAAEQVRPNRLVPFVASPEPVVVKMLEAAGLKPGETLYDLGCGDGRVVIIAAQRFGANAVGVELSEKLVESARAQVAQLGLEGRVKIIREDFMNVDLRPADVVAIYLDRMTNEKLKPKLRSQLKAGARVVSHDYPVPGWKPWRVESVEVHRRAHPIYVYRMPPTEP